MGGGLMQLVAYGAQDVYLTGNPQITFFKVIYRRHTNFALESIEQTFNGLGDWSKKVTCTISRNGDLIHRAYLRVELPSVTVPAVASGENPVMFRWLNWVGHILIKSVELEIGGQRIDKHYGDWIHIWNELTQTAGHQLGYAHMVGNTPQLTNVTVGTDSEDIPVDGEILYIPLEFFWNRNPGLALPLIALQYHEVKVNVELNDVKNCYWAGKRNADGVAETVMNAVSVPSLKSCSLFVDYVYLDTDERRRFAQVSHEYLIEQLQFTGDESTSNTNNKFKLNFNHPTKELIWVVQPDANVNESTPYGKQWFNYSDGVDNTYETDGDVFATGAYGQSNVSILNPQGAGGDVWAGSMPGVAPGGATGVYIPVSFESGVNPVASALLQLNGHDRFSVRDGKYFNLVQPYQHHENVPSCGINVYSFALRPEEHQPSGTCNFSRIDNATLQLTLTPSTVANGAAKVRIYAVNYNVLRVMSGMGGLAYSN